MAVPTLKILASHIADASFWDQLPYDWVAVDPDGTVVCFYMQPTFDDEDNEWLADENDHNPVYVVCKAGGDYKQFGLHRNRLYQRAGCLAKKSSSPHFLTLDADLLIQAAEILGGVIGIEPPNDIHAYWGIVGCDGQRWEFGNNLPDKTPDDALRSALKQWNSLAGQLRHWVNTGKLTFCDEEFQEEVIEAAEDDEVGPLNIEGGG